MHRMQLPHFADVKKCSEKVGKLARVGAAGEGLEAVRERRGKPRDHRVVFRDVGLEVFVAERFGGHVRLAYQGIFPPLGRPGPSPGFSYFLYI